MRNAVGLDISKLTFNASAMVGNAEYSAKFDNDSKGLDQFSDRLKSLGCQNLHICMEATGNYYEEVADYFAQYYSVYVVNPLKISKYAESRFKRTKTDKQDAKLIAQYCRSAQESELVKRQKPTDEQYRLSRMTAAYAQIKSECAAMKNRHHAAKDEEAAKAYAEIIKAMNEQLEVLKEKIKEQTEKPNCKEGVKRLETIPAIGRMTAAVLFHHLTSSKFETSNKFAAFAGLSPQQKESGTSVRGKGKLTKFGNRKLRAVLFMPAMVAYRIRAFPDFIKRLEEKKKPKKVIIAALMRKLAVIAYHVHKKGGDYDPSRYKSA
ncbi:IS110 family transposase [Neisseria gonorrhoeae]|uniref:IS110 family transposase n=1 Tax=Neisseria gonorrhoeae TaxID=485 RepID=UPI0010718F29|nr:transposase [Neisseria gonorrhoeae]